ncbi:hypothetical protein HHI36_011510 [Cryptolaemus montrouzieri]|uniref:C2H2-type domain-containing protein n=1 Tax=Cryptolaemus montrouzieri TaxID=559131 RepID=A0ABD2MMC4_9CUCU
MDSKDLYTCITCRVAFKDADFQRLHYKTDWHRYNLKRKVVDLPPVTSEAFQTRVTNIRNFNTQLEQDKSVYCKPCRKLFGNPNAYDNHLNSKKHKDSLKNYDESVDDIKQGSNKNEKKNEVLDESEEDVEEIDSDEWEEDVENPIDNNDCLFCSHHSKNFLKNLEHMTTAHSFFIPDIEFCVDVQGLLRYLGEKVVSGFMCLWCNEKGRTFHSVEAAKSHMTDKGHCKMLHEGVALAEYTDYYDYSTSYPDADEGVNADEEVDTNQLDDSEYQLVLPSGVKVGHRSLMRYYKQSITHKTALVPSRNTKKLHKVLATYRALGWTETQQEQAARKARDIHYLKRVQSKWY